MSFFSGLAELRDPDVGTLTNPSRWLSNWFGGGATTKAGTVVTESNALKLWAAHACVNILARTVGQLPCITYERLDRGRRKAVDHPVFERLRLRPNPEISAIAFFRCLTAHHETYGNAYALLDFSQITGQLEALWPVAPHRVHPERAPNSKLLRYRVSLPDGGPDQIVPPEKMLHIAGLGYDGVVGHSRIEMARELLGKGFALEEFTSRFFSSGTHAGLILSHPEELGPEGRESLEKSLSTDYAGLGKAHKILLLEEAMKVEKVGFDPQQSQFIETQVQTVRQVCGFWSVPPYMLGLEDKDPRATAEQKGIDFLTYTMGSLLVAWEQELNWKLYTAPERGRYYSEYLVDSLLRASLKDRYEAYKNARYATFMTGDEIRDKENMNPLNDGVSDQVLVPLNMAPASLVEKVLLKGNATADRASVRATFQPLLAERLGDVLRREVADVKDAARKLLNGEDTGDFLTWLDTYYREHVGRVSNRMATTLEQLAAVAGDPARQSALPGVWSGHSFQRLRDVVADVEDPYRAVVDEIESWNPTRAAAAAADELDHLLDPPED